VAPGDRVVSGQVLGLLGNTGNSEAPHLHFGLIDNPDPIVGLSLPMAFDRWTLEGMVTLEAYLGATDAIPSGPPTVQSSTFQLYLDVADFG
jgi:murein DD-endopeptidase MepM/ murein hydrolase activator NlpD